LTQQTEVKTKRWTRLAALYCLKCLVKTIGHSRPYAITVHGCTWVMSANIKCQCVPVHKISAWTTWYRSGSDWQHW